MTVDRKIVLHDFFLAPDGGGRVAVILAKAFHADLVTGHLDERAFSRGYFDGATPQSLDAYHSSPRWLGFSKIFQLWWAFAHFPATPASWTIFSGSFSPLAWKRIAGRKIFYCLTPPRLLYDQRDFMVQQVALWQRPLLRCVMAFYGLAYERAVRHMDMIVTISETIRTRTKEYLGLDSLVIYPPCETARFRWQEAGGFYLSTARVDPLKRVDLIVNAFKEMPRKRLVVVSGGPDLPRVKRIAEGSSNIEVLGWVDDEALCDLMGRCIATIYIPREEDFGISPVESMAAGKPVIGVQEGALLETVGRERGAGSRGRGAGGGGWRSEDRRQRSEVGSRRSEVRSQRSEFGRGLMVTDCGALVPRDPGVRDIIEAVEWMTPEKAFEMRGACEARARRFDTSVFLKKMRDLLEGEG